MAAIQVDVPLVKYSDGLLEIALEPSAPIGGQAFVFTVTKRFGGLSGLVIKSLASGYANGESGITVTNSGLGVVSIALNTSDFSGKDPGVYACDYSRVDSGYHTPVTRGYIMLDQSILQ